MRLDRTDLSLIGLTIIAAAIVLAILSGYALAQPAPVPLKPIVRPAYEAPEISPETLSPPPRRLPAGSLEDSILGGALPRLRYVPLPGGAITCSLAPGGQQVCGPGMWIADDREMRR